MGHRSHALTIIFLPAGISAGRLHRRSVQLSAHQSNRALRRHSLHVALSAVPPSPPPFVRGHCVLARLAPEASLEGHPGKPAELASM